MYATLYAGAPSSSLCNSVLLKTLPRVSALAGYKLQFHVDRIPECSDLYNDPLQLQTYGIPSMSCFSYINEPLLGRLRRNAETASPPLSAAPISNSLDTSLLVAGAQAGQDLTRRNKFSEASEAVTKLVDSGSNSHTSDLFFRPGTGPSSNRIFDSALNNVSPTRLELKSIDTEEIIGPNGVGNFQHSKLDLKSIDTEEVIDGAVNLHFKPTKLNLKSVDTEEVVDGVVDLKFKPSPLELKSFDTTEII